MTRLGFVACACKYDIKAQWPEGQAPTDVAVLDAIAGYLGDEEPDAEALQLQVPYALRILQTWFKDEMREAKRLVSNLGGIARPELLNATSPHLDLFFAVLDTACARLEYEADSLVQAESVRLLEDMLPFLKKLGVPGAEAATKRVNAMKEQGRQTQKEQKKKVER
jgi:hypothetical protein